MTTIEVADEGPGIPAGEAERVFERFHRVDAARAARDGGTGLGLAIARWIVDAHGGTIAVRDREPTGCRVVVELPQMNEEHPHDPALTRPDGSPLPPLRGLAP